MTSVLFHSLTSSIKKKSKGVNSINLDKKMNLSSKGKEEKVGCFWNHWSAEPKLMIYNYGYMHVYGGQFKHFSR